MQALVRLDGGLLVGRDNEIGLLQGSTLPSAVIEIQDAASLAGEVGVAREDPAAVLPRADGVVMQPTPDGGFADGGSDAAGAGRADEIVEAPADRGRSCWEGGSQAKARTCTTISGGESPGASGPREFLETVQAVFEEALAPEADDLAAGVEALGDEAIGEALGGEEHQLGAGNLEIRQGIAGGPAL